MVCNIFLFIDKLVFLAVCWDSLQTPVLLCALWSLMGNLIRKYWNSMEWESYHLSGTETSKEIKPACGQLSSLDSLILHVQSRCSVGIIGFIFNHIYCLLYAHSSVNKALMVVTRRWSFLNTRLHLKQIFVNRVALHLLHPYC